MDWPQFSAKNFPGNETKMDGRGLKWSPEMDISQISIVYGKKWNEAKNEYKMVKK
jgi:hypothetical protein